MIPSAVLGGRRESPLIPTAVNERILTKKGRSKPDLKAPSPWGNPQEILLGNLKGRNRPFRLVIW